MLTTVTQIKKFWRTNTLPLYFVSPSAFNLLGLNTWVKNAFFICYINSFDGRHRHVRIPTHQDHPVFEHLEDINHYLLSHKTTSDWLIQDRLHLDKKAPKSKVFFLFFDRNIEALCKALRLDICLPSFKQVKHFDSKIYTTQLGNAAGVHSVPNALAKIDSYDTLCQIAKKHKLGKKWVLQTPYGDSGKTTFFISNKKDYDIYADQIESEPLIKVMKRIRCVSAAIEGCTTSCGTFVGPLMRELIGIPSLTPYQGGWCGNDISPDGFSSDIHTQAKELTVKLGHALYQEGYRGYFEVDYLLDCDTDTMYLGELNPRFSGISALTNFALRSLLPLFLFHLLEFFCVPFSINPEIYNQKVLSRLSVMTSGQLIFKYTPYDLKMVMKAPVSGVYILSDEGELILKKQGVNRLLASEPHEIFLFRILAEHDYLYHGADMAIVFFNIPLLDDTQTLTPTAQRWIQAVQNTFQLRHLTAEEQNLVDRYRNPGVLLKGTP